MLVTIVFERSRIPPAINVETGRHNHCRIIHHVPVRCVLSIGVSKASQLLNPEARPTFQYLAVFSFGATLGPAGHSRTSIPAAAHCAATRFRSSERRVINCIDCPSLSDQFFPSISTAPATYRRVLLQGEGFRSGLVDDPLCQGQYRLARRLALRLHSLSRIAEVERPLPLATKSVKRHDDQIECGGLTHCNIPALLGFPRRKFYQLDSLATAKRRQRRLHTLNHRRRGATNPVVKTVADSKDRRLEHRFDRPSIGEKAAERIRDCLADTTVHILGFSQNGIRCEYDLHVQFQIADRVAHGTLRRGNTWTVTG